MRMPIMGNFINHIGTQTYIVTITVYCNHFKLLSLLKLFMHGKFSLIYILYFYSLTYFNILLKAFQLSSFSSENHKVVSKSQACGK